MDVKGTVINIYQKIKGKIQTLTRELYLRKNQMKLTDTTSEIKNTKNGYKSRLNTEKKTEVVIC